MGCGGSRAVTEFFDNKDPKVFVGTPSDLDTVIGLIENNTKRKVTRINGVTYNETTLDKKIESKDWIVQVDFEDGKKENDSWEVTIPTKGNSSIKPAPVKK